MCLDRIPYLYTTHTMTRTNTRTTETQRTEISAVLVTSLPVTMAATENMEKNTEKIYVAQNNRTNWNISLKIYN